MLKGNNVRPLVMKGNIYLNKNIIGRIVKKINLENKKDCIQVITCGNISLFQKDYEAYIFEQKEIPVEIKKYLNLKNKTYLLEVSNIESLYDYDIIEIGNKQGIIDILYRANSSDNCLSLTNQCNSNCVFCPESENSRKINYTSIKKIENIIKLMPDDIESLCITGGEPTLLKYNFIKILQLVKEKFKDTNILILSNGRMFSYKKFCLDYFLARPKKTIIGIAIHGDNKQIHDYCTRVKGSFEQTINGISNLYKMKEKIEIRIVVNKLNYKSLPKIAEMIILKFPNIYRVNIMGLEMLGNAAKNRKYVWIGFEEIQKYLNKTVFILLENGINTNLYNFPLCYIDTNFWQITLPSISDYKVRYSEECLKCNVKNICGGFFESTYNIGRIKVKPIEERL